MSVDLKHSNRLTAAGTVPSVWSVNSKRRAVAFWVRESKV